MIKKESVVRISEVKNRYKVPKMLRSCHTAIVDGYVIEGHVPADEIIRLLIEKPDIIGLSVPGMPSGSPGMDQPGVEPEPYSVLSFDKQGRTRVFATYPK
ncbi:DUF411 domain-containing protein [Malonomonas rubra]|uniref:DUF411 domain-containing protein n=1 Tax=Malonomonas rubra TaxID=57040 RepID=UPI0026F1E653|nr:DUF411 domain-containing protein [Malonomonas rubra]